MGRSLEQEWSGYRSHGSFGHPLYAGTFFAVSFAVAIGRWVTTGNGRLWAVAASGGVVVSVSRGALLAVVLATLATLVVGAVHLGPRRMPGLGQVVALSVLGAVAVWATGLVQGRSTSQEGAASADLRTALFDTAFDIARADGWLGSGPGTAEDITGRWLGQEIPLENSWLQLLVSLGMIGLVGMLVVFATTSLRAVGLRHVAVLPPLVALAVALAGYNAIEALLPMSTLVGLVLLLATSREPADDRQLVGSAPDGGLPARA